MKKGKFDFSHEIEIMKNLEHPNIIKLLDYHETKTKYFLFLELCEYSLLDLFKYTKKGRFTEENTQLIVI